MIDLEITIRAVSLTQWEVCTDFAGHALVRDFKSFQDTQIYTLAVRDCAVALDLSSNTEPGQ